MMAGAQLGITACSLALGAVSEPAIAHLLEPAFAALGLPTGALQPVAFALALALVSVLHVVLGEVAPKNIALASAFTRDDVAALIEQSHREGLLEPGERVHALAPAPTTKQVERLAARTGVTRVPIRDGRQITGYIHLKDILGDAAAASDQPIPARRVRALPDVPAHQLLPDAVETMRTSKTHVARVAAKDATVPRSPSASSLSTTFPPASSMPHRGRRHGARIGGYESAATSARSTHVEFRRDAVDFIDCPTRRCVPHGRPCAGDMLP
jgi:CBS domain containing-hemolysin-like protein